MSVKIQPTRISGAVIRRKRTRANRVKCQEKEMTAKIIKKIPGTRSPESARTAAREGGPG